VAQLIFCLGREPLLSLAELCSYSEAEEWNTAISRLGTDIASVQVDSAVDPQRTVRRLGGTVKIAEVVEQSDHVPDPGTIASMIVERLRPPSPGRKAVFGLSSYPASRSQDNTLKQIASLVKKQLEQEQVASRYVLPIRGNTLSSAQVIENQLIMNGAEFLLARVDNQLLLAQTMAVQPVTEEADRDMRKPVRRLREGLLPPKVARMLVNLARKPDTRSLLDPFCGSGVVLMEAALLGIHAVGSDRSGEALSAARRNLDWLLADAKHEDNQPYRLIHTKAENLSLRLPPLSIDAAVTEPYLGPPLSAALPVDRAKSLSIELSKMYTRALAEIRIVLRPGGRCVFVTPIFRTAKGFHGVNLTKHLPLIGFHEYNPLRSCRGINERESLCHSRPRQRVLRRILVLESRPE
jgi:tRNA G10  N-methylase Trm11